MREPLPGGLLPSDRVAAADFDRHRFAADNLAYWTPLLVELGGITAGRRVLDAGCATGGFAVAIAGQTGARVIGCDLSLSFLAFAGGRPRPARGSVAWTAGDVRRLPFTAGEFHCVVLSLVLHQVGDPGRTLAEAFRVLRSPGVVVIRTVLPEDAARRIPFRFFPSLARRQASLMPSLPELTGWAVAAGFARVSSRMVRRDKHLRLDEVEAAFRREAARRYPFLSRHELDTGMRRMRADWEQSGRRWVDPRPVHLVVARKR